MKMKYPNAEGTFVFSLMEGILVEKIIIREIFSGDSPDKETVLQCTVILEFC